MSKKILKLDASDTIDFLVAGIICGFRNYRICIELNEMFGFGLNRVSDITIPTGRLGSNTIHAKYVGESSDLNTCIFVANKDIYNTGYLIPELKNNRDRHLRARYYGASEDVPVPLFLPLPVGHLYSHYVLKCCAGCII